MTCARLDILIRGRRLSHAFQINGRGDLLDERLGLDLQRAVERLTRWRLIPHKGSGRRAEGLDLDRGLLDNGRLGCSFRGLGYDEPQLAREQVPMPLAARRSRLRWPRGRCGRAVCNRRLGLDFLVRLGRRRFLRQFCADGFRQQFPVLVSVRFGHCSEEFPELLDRGCSTSFGSHEGNTHGMPFSKEYSG